MKPAPHKGVDEAVVKAAFDERSQGWASENRVAALRHLHDLGLSAAQIADQIGGVTRNAVVGKLDRLGKKRTALGRSVSRGLSNKNIAPQPRPVLKVAGNGMVFEACKPGNEITILQDQPGGFRIIDPGFSGCRWPIGGEGADTRFCCAEKADGKPYCGEHMIKAAQPVPPGKKRDAKELIRSLRRYA